MAKIAGFRAPGNPTNISWVGVQGGAKPTVGLSGVQAAQWGSGSGDAANMGHPALPALWWVGLVIVLVAIRVLDNFR